MWPGFGALSITPRSVSHVVALTTVAYVCMTAVQPSTTPLHRSNDSLATLQFIWLFVVQTIITNHKKSKPKIVNDDSWLPIQLRE